MPPTSVAVIGAGPLGLLAIKNLLEAGTFTVTCFESRPYLGGIWNFSADDALSVAEHTVFNSSRYRAAFSDYPFADDTDDFPTWRQMRAYLQGYADEFGRRECLRLGRRVEGVSRVGGKWRLEGRATDEAGDEFCDDFDKAVVAVGTFHTPHYPKLPGIDEFAGMKVHALHFNAVQDQFREKRVLCIGIHASTQDVIQVLEKQGATQVYASHKNGLVLLPRFSPNGAPFDLALTIPFMLFSMFLAKYLPALYFYLVDCMLPSVSKLVVVAVVQVWLGNSVLPPLPEMQKWRREWLAWRADLLRKQKTESSFYVGTMRLEDHLRWYDEAAGTDVFAHFGLFSCKAWAFWWKDRELYRECTRLLWSPAVWRLFETGKRKTWNGARKQIYLDNEAAEATIRKRLESVQSAKSKKKQ